MKSEKKSRNRIIYSELIFLIILFTSVLIYADTPNPGHHYSDLDLGPINIQQNEININKKLIVQDSLCFQDEQEQNCKSNWNFLEGDFWEQNELGIHYNLGNVGIGRTKTNPLYKLDIGSSIDLINQDFSYMSSEQNILRTTSHQSFPSTFLGQSAGHDLEGSICVGYKAGKLGTGFFQTAIGSGAGYSNSGTRQTTIGYSAGSNNKGKGQTSGGSGSGASNEGEYQVTFGHRYSGLQNKGNDSISLGDRSGQSNLGNYQTAIGTYAGVQNTGISQTAIGYYSGYRNKGDNAISIGLYSGTDNLGNDMVSIGYYSGYKNEGNRTIFIGDGSGRENKANDVVAIGKRAARFNTLPNQFIIRQSGKNSIPLMQGDFQTGYLGIGVTNPTYRIQLPVTSNNGGKARAHSWVTYSSIRWKENINNLDGTDSVDKIMNLNPVSYDWKQEYGGSKSIGFIAEEVGKVIPEAVDFDDEGIFADGLSINPIVAYLVKVSQERQEEIEKIKKETCLKNKFYTWCE